MPWTVPATACRYSSDGTRYSVYTISPKAVIYCDSSTIRRYHDAFDYDGSDRNYDSTAIRLRSDYDVSRAPVSIRRDSTRAKNNVNFSSQSCRSRIAVVSQSNRNCDKQNDSASYVTDFSKSAEFSRNFGLKVISLFCYIKIMLSYAKRTRRNLVS